MPPARRASVQSKRCYFIRPASVRNIQAVVSTRKEGIQKILFAIRALSGDEGVKSEKILWYMRRDSLFSDVRSKEVEWWVREFLKKGLDMGVLEVRFQGSKKVFKPGPRADQFEEAVRRNGSMLPFAKDSLTQIPHHLKKGDLVIIDDLQGQEEDSSEESIPQSPTSGRRRRGGGGKTVKTKSPRRGQRRKTTECFDEESI